MASNRDLMKECHHDDSNRDRRTQGRGELFKLSDVFTADGFEPLD